MDWQNIFIIIAAGFIVFWLYRYIRSNPEALSRENLGKGFWTLGILAVGLIGFIGLLIVMLRGS